MSYKTLLYCFFLVFLMSSCHLSFNKYTDAKFKEKTINGKQYVLTSQIELKSTRLLFAEHNRLKNHITFDGMGERINKDLDYSNFASYLEKHSIKSFCLDSLSFSVSPQKDNIDLLYYFTENNNSNPIVISIIKKDNRWLMQR